MIHIEHLSVLLEEYESERHELAKAYHTFTDQVGNHFETGSIVKALKDQITILDGKIMNVLQEIDVIKAESEYEREYDKYDY